jgi:ABC-type transporter Mla subunit MlaD
MNEIINQIEELKQMQRFPRYYLSKYFEELKTQVDTKYALKLDEKDKYLEIINSIESFEQDAYNKWSSKRINTYDDEIKLIEDKLNNNLNNVIDYTKLIGDIQSAQTAVDSFRETEQNLQGAEAGLLATRAALVQELDRMQAMFGQNSKKANEVRASIAGIDGQLAGNSEKLAENAAKYQEWAAQTVYAFATARAAAR